MDLTKLSKNREPPRLWTFHNFHKRIYFHHEQRGFHLCNSPGCRNCNDRICQQIIQYAMFTNSADNNGVSLTTTRWKTNILHNICLFISSQEFQFVNNLYNIWTWVTGTGGRYVQLNGRLKVIPKVTVSRSQVNEFVYGYRNALWVID